MFSVIINEKENDMGVFILLVASGVIAVAALVAFLSITLHDD